MPFEPGVSPNPGGKPKQKPLTDALMIALKEEEGAPARNRTKMDMLATSLLNKAFNGDIPAIKEVWDRVEGKPAQAIIGGDEDDPALKALLIVTGVPRPQDAAS